MSQVEWQQLEETVAHMTEHEKQRLLALLKNSLDRPGPAEPGTRPTADEFDAELTQVTFDAPPLPTDFSRSDIYCDHD